MAQGFLKGTLILTVSGIVVKVIGSLNWVILSRVMGGEGIGLYQMGFPIYLLALSISSAGLPVAISIVTAEKLAVRDYRGARRVFRVSLSLLAASGLFFCLLLIVGAGWLVENRWIRDARAYYSIIALAPAVFFVTLLASFRGYLQGWQEMTPTAASEIVEQLFRVLTMIWLASLFMPYGLSYAAAGASMGAGVGAVAALAVLVFCYRRIRSKFQQKMLHEDACLPQEPTRALLERLVRLAFPVALSSLMLPVVANLDLLIVPARLEAAGFSVPDATAQFGYLTGMAVPLINLSTILTASLAISLVPSISEARARGAMAAVAERTASAMHIAALVTIPCAVGLYVLGGSVAAIVYNAPEAAGVIEAMSGAIFLLGLHQVTTGILQGLGHTSIPVVNMILAAVVKVVLSWLLVAIPSIGIKGAALATVADMGVAALLNMFFLQRFTGFRLPLLSWGKLLVSAAVMGVAAWATLMAVQGATGSNVAGLLAAMVVAVPVYGGLLLAIGGLPADEAEKLPFVGRYAARLLKNDRRDPA